MHPRLEQCIPHKGQAAPLLQRPRTHVPALSDIPTQGPALVRFITAGGDIGRLREVDAALIGRANNNFLKTFLVGTVPKDRQLREHSAERLLCAQRYLAALQAWHKINKTKVRKIVGFDNCLTSVHSAVKAATTSPVAATE
jgi:hypothetical protein